MTLRGGVAVATTVLPAAVMTVMLVAVDVCTILPQFGCCPYQNVPGFEDPPREDELSMHKTFISGIVKRRVDLLELSHCPLLLRWLDIDVLRCVRLTMPI